MKDTRKTFGTLAIAMLLVGGLIAPTSADHNAEHTALRSAVTDAQAALDDAGEAFDDEYAAWEVAHAQYGTDLEKYEDDLADYDRGKAEFDAEHAAWVTRSEAYSAWEATRTAGDAEIAAITSEITADWDCPQNQNVNARCSRGRDADIAAAIAALPPLGDAPETPGAEPTFDLDEPIAPAVPEAPSDAAVVAALAALEAAELALDGYVEPAPVVTDEGDPHESNPSNQQCDTAEGAREYDADGSYNENVSIDGSIVSVVVDGRNITFRYATTNELFIVGSFCLKAGQELTTHSGSSASADKDISNFVIYVVAPTDPDAPDPDTTDPDTKDPTPEDPTPEDPTPEDPAPEVDEVLGKVLVAKDAVKVRAHVATPSVPERAEVLGQVIEAGELPRTGVPAIALILMGLTSMGLGTKMISRKRS